MTLAIVLFAVALAVIASERIHRTKVAMLGGVVVVLTQTIDQEHAIEAVSWETIGLLAGMMIIVRLTEHTGAYNFMAIRAAQLSRGRPLGVVVVLALTTAVISAFLDNLTTILLMVPITFVLADALDIEPLPLIMLEIITSNIGGTATLIGDPPNIIIAGETGLSFNAFLVNLGPIALITLVVVTALLYFLWRGRLQVSPENRERVMELDASKSIQDAPELRRLLPLLALTLVAFFVHKPLGLEPTTIALGGAALMLLVTRQDIDEALRGVDWSTLIFFAGLFVMVGALEETGAMKEAADAIASATNGDRAAELLGITWTSAIASGLVDNIPFTAAMIPVVEQLQGDSMDDAYWWALAIGACFGGNATLIAAAANVAAAGMTARAGQPITFGMFLKVGVPMTFVSLLLATAYIWIRYV